MRVNIKHRGISKSKAYVYTTRQKKYGPDFRFAVFWFGLEKAILPVSVTVSPMATG